jgi:arylsulfatase
MGFDEWWGIKNTWDEAGYTAYPLFKESGMEPPMIWEGRKGEPSRPVMPLDMAVRGIVDEKYLIPKTTDFIRRQAAAKKPFFVYLGYSEVHPPIAVNPNFDRKSPHRGGIYSDLLGEMDARIGQVLDAVKQAVVEDNTIVIVSSDNASGGIFGGVGGGSNGPFRGNFMTPPFEGSIRTLAMARWPGKIPAGVVTQEIFAAHDWLPTLASIAGASDFVPKDRPIDGIDASTFLLGKSETTGRDSYMLFGADGQMMSVRWKIYKGVFRYCDGVDKPIVRPLFPMLYDLSSDPHEDWNIFDVLTDNLWMFGPMFREEAKYQTSLTKYPNIRTGEDFRGYPAQ